MLAAHRLGRSLPRRELNRLGNRRDRASPCHATLTQTLRRLDLDAMERAFSQITTPKSDDEGDVVGPQQIAIDGKTLRVSQDANGRAEHVLSAFCSAFEQSVGHVSSRGKGMEIPDALRLLAKIDLTGKVITGDAVFCQKTITSEIVAKGGDDVLPVKRNQRALLEEIETAFREPVFPPSEAHEPADLDQGRINQRSIALLPIEALSEQMRAAWPTVRMIAWLTRRRDHARAGRVIKVEKETNFLITSLNAPTPEAILRFNGRH